MENERPTFFLRFEDLRIYNNAIEYVLWMYSNTELFPDAGKHGLAGKMILSAQAIAINIAEGSGRNKTQFIYYLKMAKSSIRECIVLTTIAQKLNFLDKIAADESRNTLIEMTKMVGALIASLQRSEKPGEKTDEEDDIQPPFDKS
jgi:four helix bundle protein